MTCAVCGKPVAELGSSVHPECEARAFAAVSQEYGRLIELLAPVAIEADERSPVRTLDRILTERSNVEAQTRAACAAVAERLVTEHVCCRCAERGGCETYAGGCRCACHEIAERIRTAPTSSGETAQPGACLADAPTPRT